MTSKRASGSVGEGEKGKKVRTTSDDAGGKSVSEKSKSTVEKSVSENSTAGWDMHEEPFRGCSKVY
jgi:hypothetical protein